MDLDYNDEERAYRDKSVAFLETIASRRKPGEHEGYRRDWSRPEALVAARAHQRRKYEGGFAGISWPKEWHGQGGTPIQEAIYILEEQNFAISNGFFDVGLRMCIPTICSFGTIEQRDRHAKPALKAEEMWCQLFSEPGAGSDLAALRTRAEQKGSKWVVNGQKIWTSGAQFSHYGLLLARTDPNVPKHNGMTMFIMSMQTPGMEVRPIKQMSGSSSFNEVFMTNCEVPDEQRVGAIGDGWNVATGLLGRERSAPLSRRPDISELLEFVDAIEAEGADLLGDDSVRDKLAELYVRSEAIRLTRLRAMTALSKGKAPGPEGSIVKLADTLRLQDMASYAIDLLGTAGTLYKSAEPIKSLFEDAFFYSAGLRLAGGTDEIQRNVIAERVLKLPPDIRIDKNIPFKDVPTGSRN